MSKVVLICPKCGSEDITRDACAQWNTDSGKWELSCVYDVMNCEACGNEFYEAGEKPDEEDEDNLAEV